MKGHRTMRFNSSERRIFFISDPHFCHSQIINYQRTEFKDVYHMNQVMTDKWNSIITSSRDIVFVLGDFCFGSKKDWDYLTKTLNGTKYLILGNHDRHVYGTWEYVTNLLDIKIKDNESNEQNITLCHYPMLSWYQSHKGAYQLYGHVHGKITNKDLAEDGWSLANKTSPRQLEVGADVWDYTPVSWETVKHKIEQQIKKAQS